MNYHLGENYLSGTSDKEFFDGPDMTVWDQAKGYPGFWIQSVASSAAMGLSYARNHNAWWAIFHSLPVVSLIYLPYYLFTSGSKK